MARRTKDQIYNLKLTKDYWYKEVWKGKLIFSGLEIMQYNIDKWFKFEPLNMNTDTYRVKEYING